VALLSRMMRSVAVTGRTDNVHGWFADRQQGRWAERTFKGALPQHSPPPSHEDQVDRERRLTGLHAAGDLSDAELAALRSRLAV
jgi:hypothetical protein